MPRPDLLFILTAQHLATTPATYDSTLCRARFTVKMSPLQGG